MRRIESIFTARDAENMTYIHELKEWPRFSWNEKGLSEKLAAVRNRQGRLTGRMETLGFKLRAEAHLQSVTEEVIKSSEIEGEVLNRDQVAHRSRVASASTLVPSLLPIAMSR